MAQPLDKALPVLAAAAVIAALASSLLVAPAERTMGDVQRIFYTHLGCAAAAFAAFTVVLAASLAFLVRRAPRWDILARSGAECGVLFCTLVLLTGPLWARPVWGRWWVWDPRLTTTLILWFLYFGYLALRGAVHGRRGATVAAVYAVLAYADVPVVYFSVRWWRGMHPQVLGSGGGLDPGMVPPLLLSVAAFLLLLSALVRERYRLGLLEAALEEAEASEGGRIS